MPYKILIIEDHPATAQMISEVLKIEGYTSFIASDGQIGVEKATIEKPNLILLDVMMPGLNGIEVCRQLKGNPVISTIPVIIVTVRGSIEDKKKGFEAGCAEYIVKPFELKELLNTIKRHLP